MDRRPVAIAAASGLFLIGSPSAALAAESLASPGSPLRLGVSLVGLIVAVVLLIEALTVRKVAMGGAIADKISYVVLAILCLAASAIAQWTGNFVAGLTLEQIGLASELLVIVSMALLAVYFYSVRRAMQEYLKAMTGGEALRAESEHHGGADA